MKKTNQHKTLCVFCGSSYGKYPVYKETTKQLGIMLAQNSIRLIYGGGSLGLMGELANSVYQNNGNVLGVIPKHLLQVEGINETNGEIIITDDMHTRKKTMHDNADAFLCLPGGIGTLEEISETITWYQLNISRKPIFFLNINGYWDNLKKLLEQFVSQKFAREELLNYFLFFDSVESLAPSLLNSLEIASNE